MTIESDDEPNTWVSLGSVLRRVAGKLTTQSNFGPGPGRSPLLIEERPGYPANGICEEKAPTPEGAEAVSRTDADGPARPARAGGVTGWGVAQAKRTAFREYGAPGGMGAGCETPLVGVHPDFHLVASA
jgi:hypothetical protein